MVHTGHPNSRPVTVHRAGSFLSRAHEKEETVQEYFSMANKSVGSYWEGGMSMKVGSGLSFDEQRLLMPHIINCEAEDREFRVKVENFFHELDTKVPFNTGVSLETGLENNNNAAISSKNLPLDIMDFVRWRQLKGHPEVALSKKEADSSPLKLYYIFDPAAIQNNNKKLIEDKDAAVELYLKLKSEPEKINMVITLLGRDVREFTGPHKDDDKLTFLRESSESDPIKFKGICIQEDLSIRYWLENAVKVGVLNKVGQKFIDVEAKDSKGILGNTIEEAVMWFKDPENNQYVVMLKSRIQEASKKSIIKGERKTELTPRQLGARS